MTIELKLAGMEIHPVSLKFKRGFSISRGKIGEAGSMAPHVFTTLVTEEGRRGWGESRSSHLWSYETNETVVTTLEHYLGPAVLGLDPTDLPRVHARMDAVIAPGITVGQPIAKSSVDIACHDLWCRSKGISISEHFGGRGEAKIDLTYLISAESPSEAYDQTKAARKWGYSGFKIKIGRGIEEDLEVISSCRQAAGNAFLWADANQAYDYAGALRLARGAHGSDLQILEQPLIATDRKGLISLDRESPVKIAVDESVFSCSDLKDFTSRGYRGAVVIKTAKSGGLLPAREMILHARDAGLEVLGSGLTEGMVGFSASLQLFHASGIDRPVDLNGPQFIEDHIGRGPVVEGGRARATGPGLGVELDLGKLEGEGRRQITGRS